MDKAQFNEWLQKHQKAYPAIVDWFAALPDQKGTLAIWFDVLKFVEKAHADEATMRMVRGVEPIVRYANWHDTPRFVTDHAHQIKRDARPPRTFTLREVDGVDTYRCHKCRDTGVVEVFHGTHVRAIRNGTFRGEVIHRAARCCSHCDAGKRKYPSLAESGAMNLFNPQSDVLVPTDRAACSSRTLNEDIDAILGSDSGPVSLDEWATMQ